MHRHTAWRSSVRREKIGTHCNERNLSILLAVDRSEASEKAAECILRLLKVLRPETAVTVAVLYLRSATDIPTSLSEVGWSSSKLGMVIANALSYAERSVLDRMRELLEADGITVVGEDVSSASAQAVCRFAAQQGCDLIVLARPPTMLAGYSPLARLMGDIIRRAPCPVLVVAVD